ncbi:MAG: hypothetical protein JSS83_23330 [Cyanobacteria bacterium SZAS LIN-3]|nr:hypothetical protein [Cyanobacteria bacterium SZAS LIN-3]
MDKNMGEQSPDSNAPNSGFCGRLDFDYYFDRIKEMDEPDDTTRFQKMLTEAEQKMYTHHLEAGLSAYEQAYDLARGSVELGQDECYAVMYHLHFFGFDQQAYRMCVEMTQLALEQRDTDILRDIWRILPEIGIPCGDLNDNALTLRDGIAGVHPEVMLYEKSRRL